jgi:uncharacterized radical SAM superfamily Fe-S cluster-containing enzyme
MTELLVRTGSLCPVCLRRIPARRTLEGGRVFLEKSCPEHGDFGRVLLWNNNSRSYNEWNRTAGSLQRGEAIPELKVVPAQPNDGCPSECGLCPQHEQLTCTALIEVTRQCNLDCAFCFAGSGTSCEPDPDLGSIAGMLQFLLDRSGPCPIQLSGGEPTLRDDLPEIVALARKIGFDHIQINTNGVRLARDPDYGAALRDAGVSSFFLQFDGITEDVYCRIRRAELLQLKLEAIERCAGHRIGVILVPTLVKGINENQIGAIIQFAKSWIPTVKGVHFQPVTYLGRYPGRPRNEDRLLIPDVLRAIEDQTAGEIKIENLVPPG